VFSSHIFFLFYNEFILCIFKISHFHLQMTFKHQKVFRVHYLIEIPTLLLILVTILNRYSYLIWFILVVPLAFPIIIASWRSIQLRWIIMSLMKAKFHSPQPKLFVKPRKIFNNSYFVSSTLINSQKCESCFAFLIEWNSFLYSNFCNLYPIICKISYKNWSLLKTI
jgi:hypothetical protein